MTSPSCGVPSPPTTSSSRGWSTRSAGVRGPDRGSRRRRVGARTLDVLADAVIAVWGLTFKAGTDDLRNSPAVEVVKRLVEGGAVVQAFDPTIPVPDGKTSVPVEASSDKVAAGGRRGDRGPRLPRRLRRL